MSDVVTMAEMKDLCLSEASRLDVVQTDLVETKVAASRSPEADYRIRVYEAIVNLIDICKGDQAIIDRLKKITSLQRAQKQSQQKAQQEGRVNVPMA